MKTVRNGPPDRSKAWIAGWDASITFESNPYKRRDYAKAFESGRMHGKRSNADDVRILNLMLSRRSAPAPPCTDCGKIEPCDDACPNASSLSSQNGNTP